MLGTDAVRCRGLVKRYGDVVAVNGLDLEAQRGECFGLLGPNGAGKTTSIEILEGLMAPDAGDVEVLGKRRTTDPGVDPRAIGHSAPGNATRGQAHGEGNAAALSVVLRRWFRNSVIGTP